MPISSEADDRLRPVTSRPNALVKELRRAFFEGEPTAEGAAAIEGVRIIEEAVRSGLRFQAVFFSESGRKHAARLLPQISNQAQALLLPDSIFSSAVSTETPQGVAALVKLKPAKLEDLVEPEGGVPLVVAVAGIQDPGNLGTIIRSAEAFGARGVLLGEKTVHATNPKVVRGSAGSAFREPLIPVKLAEAIAQMKQQEKGPQGQNYHDGRDQSIYPQ